MSEQRQNDHKNLNRSVTGLALLILILVSIPVIYYFSSSKNGGINIHINSTKITTFIESKHPEARTAGLGQSSFYPSGTCNVSYINSMNYNNTVTVTHGSIIGIGGWLVDKIDKDVPRKSWLIMTNLASKQSYQVPITTWSNRPDVREAFGGNPGYSHSGFIVDFKTDKLKQGNYHLFITYKSNGVYYTCDNGRHFIVG